MAHCQRLSITGEDGAIVLSLQVPQLPRVHSAPNITTAVDDSINPNGIKTESPSKPGTSGEQDETKANSQHGENEGNKQKMEMTKRELIKKYQLHLFVFLIFLATVISVGLSWYYRELSLRMLQSTQTIFFDPRTRLLTLRDPTDAISIEGHLGLDMPKWQLPLHCPVVVGEDPSSRRCEWKNNAIMSINHFGNASVQCYNVSWDSLHPQHVPYDCFNLKDSAWYGPSNQSASTFPIGGQFVYKPTNQRLGNNGIFSHVEDFYWLSSTGVALQIHGHDPIHVFWNETGDGKVCILSNHTGSLFHQGKRSYLDYTLCNGISPSKTHAYMRTMFPPSSVVSFPPDNIFLGYFWSFKGFSALKRNISQDSILDFANYLNNHSQNNAKIVIDTRWQASHGDLTFDPELYPNVTEMVTRLNDFGFQVVMTVSPSIHHTSYNFKQGIDTSLFVHDAGGEVAGLVKASEGVAAIVDVFNSKARRWYQTQIQALLRQLPNASLRLTYGTGSWMPYKPRFHSRNASPSGHRTIMTETVSQVSQPVIVQHTSNTRHISQLTPVPTRVTRTSDRMCMSGAIDSALTLGLMGYPFVLLEGLDLEGPRSGHRNESDMETELFIRWLQMAAFFPAAQMSIPPWTYGQTVVSTADNFSSLHQSLVLPLLQDKELRQQVAGGMPILRPVWWLDTANKTVHQMKIKDEFLIGDHILIAPVLCTGVTSRDIYVPPGVWEDKDTKIFVLGPKVVQNYPVPLHNIAVFHRHEMQGEKRNK